MDEAAERISVRGAPERCFAVAVDFEAYPRWATDVKEVEVLQRDDQGRGSRVRYAISALGQSVGYTLDYDYTEAPGGFSWRLVEGTIVRVLDGAYRFDAVDGAEDLTEVGYRLAIDLAVPLPGFLKRKAAERIIHSAMRGFKDHVEKGD